MFWVVVVAIDLVAAGLTAACVSPFVAALDEAIARSNQGEPLLRVLLHRSSCIARSPREFFGSTAFAWMWRVYLATYGANNVLRSFEAATSIDLGFGATVVVTAVCTIVALAKDAAYAKLFSTKDGKDSAARRSTPLTAYVAWFLRDLVAFTFTLTLPPLIEQHLGVSLTTAKMCTPLIGTMFTTPFNFFGVSVCERPAASLSVIST
jgi:hypothetical protein